MLKSAPLNPVMPLLAVADLAVIWGGATTTLASGTSLLLHLMLSTVATAVWWRSGIARRLAPALVMTLGPAAMLVAINAPSLRAVLRTGQDRDRGIPGVAPTSSEATRFDGHASIARLLDGRVHHPEPRNLGSLMVVLDHGTLPERRSALETAVRNFDPRLSPVIARALSDSDQTIRALAAAAASRIAAKLAETRQTFAQALASDDHGPIPELRRQLIAHAHHDVLLTEAQREAIRIEAAAGACHDPAGAAGSRLYDAAMALWQARDFDGFDRLCRKAVREGLHLEPPLRGAIAWWAAQC